MANCTGNCYCCGYINKAKSIATEDGVTTITIADGALTSLCVCQKVCVGIFTSIPAESECNIIRVTDGTDTYTVFNSGVCQGQPCNQRWRPCRLRCRSVLVLRYLDDPKLLVLQKIKGGY